MKFAHMADVHIGSWRDAKMKDLSTKAFEEAVNYCIQEKVDFVLIAGDLFNTAIPGIDYVKDVFRALKKLKDQNIGMYFIPGSHDFSHSGKTMLDVIEEAGLGINVMKFNDDELIVHKNNDLCITGINGLKGELDRNMYQNLKIKGLKDDCFKIFMFHTTINELKPSELKMMDSMNVSLLPKGFDYYAGGHIHIIENKSFENLGLKNVIYPGPLFPANFSELEKLGKGGFFIYDSGKIIRKDIVVKETKSFLFDVNKKSVQQIMDEIKKRFESEDVSQKIILFRLQGMLKEGKVADLDLKKVVDFLYEKGAYFVMKSTAKVSGEEFAEQEMEEISGEELEESIIKDYVGQIHNEFDDEINMTKKLLKVFSLEKNEGEKVSDYDERIKNEADSVLFKK